MHTLGRWLTIGVSSRRYCGAHFTGLRDLAEFTLEDPEESEYNLSGIRRAQEEELLFMVVAAVASHPADGAMRFLFKDARVASRLHDLEQVIRDQFQLLFDLRHGVWAL